jgi:fumarate hydratase subunit beta
MYQNKLSCNAKCLGGNLDMERIHLPLKKDIRIRLVAGQELLLCGRIYTARDAAHKKLYHAIKAGKPLPIVLKDNVLYYCGPTPAKQGAVIGSCGPTTSYRMDRFTPLLLEKGLGASIGKGRRSDEVVSFIKKYKSVYFAAIGGAGAYLSSRVERAKAIAYKDLGTEAIYELWVKDFPVIVAIDSKGRNVFKNRRLETQSATVSAANRDSVPYKF